MLFCVYLHLVRSKYEPRLVFECFTGPHEFVMTQVYVLLLIPLQMRWNDTVSGFCHFLQLFHASNWSADFEFCFSASCLLKIKPFQPCTIINKTIEQMLQATLFLSQFSFISFATRYLYFIMIYRY